MTDKPYLVTHHIFSVVIACWPEDVDTVILNIMKGKRALPVSSIRKALFFSFSNDVERELRMDVFTSDETFQLPGLLYLMKAAGLEYYSVEYSRQTFEAQRNTLTVNYHNSAIASDKSTGHMRHSLNRYTFLTYWYDRLQRIRVKKSKDTWR
jgi:hypothetical protein